MLMDRNTDSTVTETKRSKKKIVKKLIIALLIVFGLIAAALAAGGYYFLNMIQQVPLTEGPDTGPETADSESSPLHPRKVNRSFLLSRRRLQSLPNPLKSLTGRTC
jgi:flagellar basal body-associated protein FliL